LFRKVKGDSFGVGRKVLLLGVLRGVMVFIGSEILRNGVVGAFDVSEDSVYLDYNKWGNAYNGCGF